MISAFLYKKIYMLLVTILTLVTIDNRKCLAKREDLHGSVLLCLFLVFFIGYRPHDGYYFSDTANYADWWGINSWNGFTWNTNNKIFDNIYNFMGSVFPDATEFFVLIAAVYFICILIACRKLFPANTLIAFLVYLSAFSTFTYATNGIKAGAAASLFLVALAYRDKMWLSIIFLFFSWGVHHSMQLPVVAYVLTLIFKNKNWYFGAWLFCLFMAIGNVRFFQNLFAGLTDESGADYLISLNNDWGGKSGFRIDLVIYSVMPVIMGYYVKYKYKLEDRFYDIMLNIYLTCNGVWMLCMYAQFTNRIAYLSWFLYPILLIYPCFAIRDEKHPLVMIRKKVVLFHLIFTLFMEFLIYA